MTFKCNHCGSRAKFDIEKQLLRCESCDRLLLNIQIEHTEIQFDRYHCSSCGSGLNVNEGEMTSNCPYCGAQSIVYEGKEEEFPVEYIIPFKVSYNNAVALIKEEFTRYKYAPKQIREFDIEAIRPVYVPYWITDLHLASYQELEGRSFEADGMMVYNHKRSVEADFFNVPQDGSFKLKDSLSERLAPWHEEEKIEFDPKYLAGLYANTLDLNRDDAANLVINKAKEFIDDAIMSSCGMTKGNKALSKKYRHEVGKQKLVLMPIWFFSSSYNGKRYAAVINGQTGKIISAVPHYKFALALIAVKYTALSFIPVMSYLLLTYLCFTSVFVSVGYALGVLGIPFLIKIFNGGMKSYSRYKKVLAETWSDSLVSFSKEDL